MSDIMLVSKIKKKTLRVGRGPGSGMGKTSGRGHKGQKARAGGSIRRGFEGGQMPLYRRLPKRGFYNLFRKEVQEVKMSNIVSEFKDGSTITPETLFSQGLIKKNEGSSVKVINDIKELNKKFTMKVQGISAGAKSLVEKAGGAVEILAKPVRVKQLENKGQS